MGGWISLNRKILKNPLLQTRGRYSKREAFIYLLLKANYEPSKFNVGSDIIDVAVGQMVTSIKGLCKEFKWGNTRLRNFLKLLKNDGMIDYISTNKLTLITLLNYSTYQNNKHQTNTKHTSNKHQTHTSNKNNKLNKEIREANFREIVLDEFKKVFINEDEKNYNDFCDYWTESNDAPNSKLRFEKQRTFSIKRRLAKWIKNNKEWDKNTNTSTGYKSEDYPFEPNGYNRMGWCEKCNICDFYNKFTIHKEDSRCCNAKILPKRKEV